MLKMRQPYRRRFTHTNSGEEEFLVRTLSANYSPGFRIHWHSHDWHQLIYAARGVMTVETEIGTWVVPPERGVWVPADTRHAISMTGLVEMRTLYFPVGRHDSFPTQCSAANISPLLRELILKASERNLLRAAVPYDCHLAELLIDELKILPAAPLQLPMPKDHRALNIANHYLANPGDRKKLEGLARSMAVSKRTLERLFVAETGMTFHRWRQQLRIIHAMKSLANGESVAEISNRLGYDSSSAFISMFRKIIGLPPAKYFAQRTPFP